MPNVRYNLVNVADGGENITVVVNGEMHVASSDHPNFDEIVKRVREDDESVVDLFDVAKSVVNRFERLGERVTVGGNTLFLDGEEIHDALAKQILRFVQEGVQDFKPLVLFMEKVVTNPQEHSREQLYTWLQRHNFTIDEDGDILAYKGVRKDADGNFTSISRGPAVVDGVAVDGAVPNPVGAIVEMPRSKVTHDPRQGCSTGLHVGTWSYAHNFAQGAVLLVKVNPRDIVSVPTDCDAQKVRCCRYKVVEVTEQENTSAYRAPVVVDDVDDDEYDYEDYDEYDDILEDAVVTTPDPTDAEVVEAVKTLDNYTLKQLRKVAQDKNVRVNGKRPSHCTKQELLDALS